MRKGLGCLFVVGVVLVLASGAGVFWLFDSLQRVTGDEQVEGVIVELIESRDSEGDLLYAPVVEYVVDGTSYRIESSVSYGGLVVPDIGDSRTVYYDPDDPTDATFRGFWTLWFLPALLTLLPLTILIVIVAAAVRAQRKRSEAGIAGTSAPGGAVAVPEPSMVEADILESLGLGFSGEEIIGDFMGVEVSPMDAKGDVRYRVRAQAELDDEIVRFVGPWLDDDPTLDYMRIGNRVRIRIDPADPSRYDVLGPAAEN
jgi:hypothetical protein